MKTPNNALKLGPGAIVAIVLSVLLTIGSGLAHGWLDDRWVAQPDMQQDSQRLNDLPEQLGDWIMESEDPLPDAAQQQLRCYGYCNRTYHNTKTGERVTLAILLGPRGPMAVHTPEICYTGRGKIPAGKRQAIVIEDGDQKHSLWMVQFLSNADNSPTLGTYYGWSDGGAWQASKYARFWLTDRLYKLQLAGPPSVPGTPSTCEDFLALLLPALQPLLSSQTL